MKIGVVGMGVVGTALAEGFRIKGYEVRCYDKYKSADTTSLDNVVNDCKAIFVCVPTPQAEDGGTNLSILDSVVADIATTTKQNLMTERFIIIKSTVTPGTTRAYQEKYKDCISLFASPEFLDSGYALRNFLTPDKIIIGYTKHSKKFVHILKSLFLPFVRFESQIIIMHSDEAEMVKYMTNAYYVLKTVFINEMYDLCMASNFADVNFADVRDAFVANHRIGNSHFEPIHKGGRGAGGACLSKDLSALIQYGVRCKVSCELLRKAEAINARLLRETRKK